MSNNNAFWGKRFGFVHKDGTLAFVVRQVSSGRNNQNKARPIQNVKQSMVDKAKYQIQLKEFGIPFLIHGKGKRIQGYSPVTK